MNTDHKATIQDEKGGSRNVEKERLLVFLFMQIDEIKNSQS
jgi:hypothetical protein